MLLKRQTFSSAFTFFLYSLIKPTPNGGGGGGEGILFHFTVEETKAQRGKATVLVKQLAGRAAKI